MLVRVDRVITAVDQCHAEIDERISRDGAALSCFDNSFLDCRPEVLRDRTAEDLIDPFETRSAIERLEDAFAIPELTASARLFLVPALDLDLLRDRFLVRNL